MHAWAVFSSRSPTNVKKVRLLHGETDFEKKDMAEIDLTEYMKTVIECNCNLVMPRKGEALEESAKVKQGTQQHSKQWLI